MKQRVGASDVEALRALWLCVAVSCPLFGVMDLRLNLGVLHIPIPMMFVGIIAVGGFYYLAVHRCYSFSLHGYQVLAIFCFIFFLLHLCSLYFSLMGQYFDYFRYAVKEVVKVATSMVCFWFIIIMFPKDRAFLLHFWRVVLWSSALILSYYMYRSFQVQSSFLAVHLEDMTIKAGRNQLAWYISMIFPFVFCYSWSTRHKIAGLILMMVTSTALIYSMSRSSWFCVLMSLCYLVYFVGKTDRRQAIKMTVVAVISIGCIVAVALLLLSTYADMTELVRRALWIIRPEDVPEFDTYVSRSVRLLTTWQAFLTSPMMGHGVHNAVWVVGSESHNDYFTILASLGIVGELLFLAILGYIVTQCWWARSSQRYTTWVSLASRGALLGLLVSLNFINIYTSPQFWFFLGVFIIAIQSERSEEPRTA